MGFKYLDQPFVFGTAVFQVFHFVAAGAKGTTWGVFECSNGSGGFFAGIDQVFVECTQDAILAGIDCANLVPVFPAGFNNTGCRCIDYSGHPS